MVLFPGGAGVFERIVRGRVIAARLNQDVDHIAVLIHRPPQIVLLSIDSNKNFVQMPSVAEATLTPLQTSGTASVELLTPDSNRNRTAFPRSVPGIWYLSISSGIHDRHRPRRARALPH